MTVRAPGDVAGWMLGTALGFVGITYVGYPVAVIVRSRLAPRPHSVGEFTGAASVIVAAHDEADVIAEKVRSVLDNAPTGVDVEVIVVDDGSSDGTADAAASVPGARVLRLPRSGKAAALLAGVSASRSDLLVFTDANSMFRRGTLSALLAPFADPAVGGVAGDQHYRGGSSSVGERAHWNFDRLLKMAESRCGSTVSATGALYAIRRRHFSGVPAGVTDDFWISTGVVVDGARLVFAPDAVVTEAAAASARAEHARKVRVMTRGLRGVIERRALLSPRFGAYAVSFAARKIARRLTAPAIVVGALASLVEPRRSWLRTAVAGGSLTTASLGLVGWVGPPRIATHPVIALPLFACHSVVAALRAIANTVAGRQITQWEAGGAAQVHTHEVRR